MIFFVLCESPSIGGNKGNRQIDCVQLTELYRIYMIRIVYTKRYERTYVHILAK